MGRRRVYDVGEPRRCDDVDVDAHILAMRPDATARGMYFNLAIDYARRHAGGVDVFAAARLEYQQFRAFLSYPYDAFLRLTYAAAVVSHPDVAIGEALRRVGGEVYGTLLRAQVGRVIFSVLEKDFGRVVAAGARGWRISQNFGHVQHELLGAGHAALHFRDMPSYLETYQVGVVEGAMRWCGVEGEVEIELKSLTSATMELWWS